MREMGFELLVEDTFASPVATAVRARPEFEVSELQEYLAEAHSILISGGIGPLRGEIFRVGHMGEANTRPFLLELLFGVETFLRQRGLDVPVGTGLVGLEDWTGEVSTAGTDQRLM
jgi:aspartate aminotransferase-like enzyme